MSGEPESTAPLFVGLSIEPANEAPHLLVLKLGTSRFGCNLEPDYPEFTSDGKAISPVRTLDCWISELERLADGDPMVLLPFDFSDQCTGWLQVGPVHDGLVEVQAGWSGIGQYEVDASDLIATGRGITDFEPVRNARIERPLTDIIAAVTAARKSLADHRGTHGTARNDAD